MLDLLPTTQIDNDLLLARWLFEELAYHPFYGSHTKPVASMDRWRGLDGLLCNQLVEMWFRQI